MSPKQALSVQAPSPAPASTISVVDDSGFELTLPKPASRLLALYGAMSEMALALDLGELLVGRTAADARIDALKHLPVVGTHMRPDTKMIVDLQPDVIFQFLGQDENQSLGLGLRKLGLPVLLFRLETFEDMYRVLEVLGTVTGRDAQAKALIASYTKRLGTLRNLLMDERRVSVFYELRYPFLLGVGSGSIINTIIEMAGGRNVISLEGRLVRIREEELLVQNPQAYIIQRGTMNSNPLPVHQRPNYDQLQAVQQGRVLEVDELFFARPGPRAVESVEKLARWLHPTVNFDIEFE